MSARDLRFGLIGCGNLGAVHARCVSQMGGARFTAFADAVPAAAERLSAEHGGGYATDDIPRLLGDPDLDAVYICTHHDSHASLAIAAAQAGKHILIEKPLSLSVEECEAVAAAVEEAGVWLMPAFKMRYYPLLQKAREFIPEPQVIVGQMMDDRWRDDAWAQDPVRGGANVYSQGCHTTDVIRWMARSEPELLWAAGGAMTHPGHPRIDQCVASIRFASGAVASWIQGDAALGHMTSKFFLELFGGGRSVQLHDRFKQATFNDGERQWSERVEKEEGFLLENREFISALRAGRAPELDGTDGIQATRIVLAADRAIRTGEVQRL
jgi:predicted dehydrogenase